MFLDAKSTLPRGWLIYGRWPADNIRVAAGDLPEYDDSSMTWVDLAENGRPAHGLPADQF
jgi:hypothetical protein